MVGIQAIRNVSRPFRGQLLLGARERNPLQGFSADERIFSNPPGRTRAIVKVQDPKMNARVLMLAMQGDVINMKLAHLHGGDYDAVNEYGQTPLMLAAANGHADVIFELLDPKHCTPIEFRTRLNATDKYGWTALLYAARAGHPEAVQTLIMAGANVNVQNFNGDTPLIWACTNGHKTVVKQLLEAGADPFLCNRHGTTPRSTALSHGHAELLELLPTPPEMPKEQALEPIPAADLEPVPPPETRPDEPRQESPDSPSYQDTIDWLFYNSEPQHMG